MQNQLIAPPKAPITSVKPTARKGFKRLVLGSAPVDAMLAKHRVPKGTLLHFDYVGDPGLHLLALCRAAIWHGQSVAFVYVPTLGPASWGKSCKDERTPDPTESPLNEQMGYYGLDEFLNEADPTDPAAVFRYFVALSPDELEEDLDALLGVRCDGEPGHPHTVAPDLIVVYDVDRLFAVEGLSQEGVSSRLERLGHIVDTYSAHCARTSTTMWFGRSANFHKKKASPILRGINDLLYERCRFGLSVDSRLPGEETRTCADYRQGLSASLPAILANPATSADAGEEALWHICLYSSNALLDTIGWAYDSEYGAGDHFLDGGPEAGDLRAVYDEQSLEEQSSQE